MRRRRFLQVASVTGAGLAAGCGSGAGERWMPYLVPNEDLIPGIPTWYASTCRECPAGCGILVKTREGRPVKIEGNEHHPVNRGRLCARGQAALQGLYDPDRITGPMRREQGRWLPMSWEEAEAQLAAALGAAAASGADRVAFVGPAEGGPLDRFYDTWLAAYRSRRRLRYEPFAHEPLREASRLVFGVAGIPRPDFRGARYILSFGADFLETWLSPVEFTGAFADIHGYHDRRMARFVSVEPRRGLTGFNADEWVAPRPGTEHLVALGIANAIVRSGRARVSGFDAEFLRAFLSRFDAQGVSERTGVAEQVIERLANEFMAGSPSLAVAGGVANQHRAATQLAVAVNLLNWVAGNVGRTVTFPASSVWDRLSSYRDVTAFIAAMNAGDVDVALFHGGVNPAFALPGSAGFAEALGRVRLKVSFASHMDETTALCDVVLPDHTPLEQWGASEPVAGVLGMVQPTVQPVHQTRQTADVLLSLAGPRAIRPALQSARALALEGTRDVEATLQRGGAWTDTRPRAVRLVRDFARLDFRPATFDGTEGGLVLLTVPSAMLYDGRGANRSWLQEIPDPATKIAWQTWVEVNPGTAARLGLRNGDVVTVSAGGQRQVGALVYVFPGVRPDVVAMPIGRGHTAYGRYARGNGSNPLSLLGDVTDASGALAFCQTRVTLARTGEQRRLATTEGSPRQMGRGIARTTTLAAVLAGERQAEEEPFSQAEKEAIAAQAAVHAKEANLGIYGRPQPKWEMAIDLSRCTGCSACVAACYAENNIPTVGEQQIVRSREMAWIRLERYFEGDTSGTDWHVAGLPMLCQQCANAPCEPVCPVYAAYHTPDGLNGQVYNRCVGTRYCANNCPYKVRYFNWWDYGEPGAPYYAFPGTLHWQLNPDVTVRTKGVMEKCTFCVQRIRFAQNDARVRGRELVDGDIVPACAQTCPAAAITFGDAHDPNSRVSRLSRDERGYKVFAILNTKPGITYLTRVMHSGAAAEA